MDMDQLEGIIRIGKHSVSFNHEALHRDMDVFLGYHPWLWDKNNEFERTHRHFFYVMTPYGRMEVFFRGSNWEPDTVFFACKDWPTEEE